LRLNLAETTTNRYCEWSVQIKNLFVSLAKNWHRSTYLLFKITLASSFRSVFQFLTINWFW